MAEIEHARVLIAGFGVEGQAAYKYLRNACPECTLGVFDEMSLDECVSSIELKSKISADKHTVWYTSLESIKWPMYEVVLKSPGIPPQHQLLSRSREQGLPITTQVEIFFDRTSRQQIIGITGTKGKSTTATLCAAMLRNSDQRVELLGNIGIPVISTELTLQASTKCVIELSSYQLFSLRKSPHVAVVLEIVPEHLDYHGGLDAYVEAKENITRFQSEDDYCIYNSDSPLSSIVGRRSLAVKLPLSIERELAFGGFLEAGRIIVRTADTEQWVIDASDVPMDQLPGRFNLYNVLAAMLAAKVSGAKLSDVKRALSKFKALPHRLEVVGTVKGITFIDNSIATVPSATIAALKTFGNRVQTLILGGFDRGVPYDGLAQCVVSETGVKNVALLPGSGPRIAQLLTASSVRNQKQLLIKSVETMREAVKFAFEFTEDGHICLLSPAAASFGLFKDYKDRGDRFKEEVQRNSDTYLNG